MTPKKTEYYDYECQQTRTKLELDEEHKRLALDCNKIDSCLIQVVFLYTAGALVSVVSGSIVLVGNSISWIEKKATC